MKAVLEQLSTIAGFASVVAVLALECAVAAAPPATGTTGEPAEAGRLTHVFQHICENPRLGAVLKRHRVSDTDSTGSAGRTVCAIGDFVFRRAEIHLELYPAPDADELWIADESARLGPNATPRVVVRLRRDDEALFVTRDTAPPLRFRRERGDEDRLMIVVSDGKVTISDERSGGRRVLGEAVAVQRGVQLLVPSEGDSCGPEDCGLLAIDVYLDLADKDRWTKAGLMRTDEPSR
jgi:hypothetical protein